MYNVRIDFEGTCWASGGWQHLEDGFWRRGNGNSKCERSRNSKGRNSECLLLILAQVQPWLPGTPRQAQWPLSGAHAPELSVPT